MPLVSKQTMIINEWRKSRKPLGKTGGILMEQEGRKAVRGGNKNWRRLRGKPTKV